MKKLLSLLLALTLMIGLLSNAGFSLTTKAVDIPDAGVPNKNSLVLNKTATANADGTYTITLEAYATGNKITSTVKKNVPTDIVLVLDQSGSMANDIGSVRFSAYNGNNTRNSNFYEKRHNGGSGNLWYKLSDGSYASVSVSRTATYTALSTNLVNWNVTTSCYWYYAENLYEKVGAEYKKVTVERSGNYWDGYSYTYTYTFSDGSTVVSSGNDAIPSLGTHSPLYTPDSANVYTYTYTDATGAVKTIGTSTGDNNNFTGATLYQRNVSSSGGGSRLEALKAAVKNFANSVAQKAAGPDGDISTTDDNINHRIAMVGFSGTSYSYSNTEIFVGNNEYNYRNASSHYKEAFQSMDTATGKNNVLASVGKLTADGSTYIHHGMELANGILDANPVKQGETRNRVIIVFTDGVPGYSTEWYSDSKSTGESAMSQAKIAKDNGTTVYAVGIMAGADPTTEGSWENSASEKQKVNYFMQNLSSNNGQVQSPSYYLSASDSNSLNDIFMQISSNIESGGSSTTLDSSAVIKDIIAPQFQLPEGATASNITLQTATCTGIGFDNEYTWSTPTTATGVTAAISGDNVNVTGFDFSKNWVGTETNNGSTTYRGSKLIISFKVETKDGFLGGNDVYTNTSAGVYENANATEPVQQFNRPTVNVAIKDVTVTAADKNVYLLGELTSEQIKEGATVSCGDVDLDLSKDDYGLKSWQTDYVNIEVTYTDKDGNTVTDLSNLDADTTYTVTATVTPKTDGSTTDQGTVATEKTGSKEGKINVFQPELTFQDSEVYYGDNVPTSYESNLTKTEWKHGETLSTEVTMIGDKPTLDLTYTPEDGKIADGKINSKQDIPVDVTVKINGTDVTGNTTFQHTDCTGREETLPTDKEFLLHVKTCQLTIKKQAASGTTIGNDEYFVFNVKKDGATYTQVTIQGTGSVEIKELPVGTYTVEEDASTAWRYTSAMSQNSVTLSKDNTSGSVTCTNTKTNDKWLNHFAQVTNTFGKTNN